MFIGVIAALAFIVTFTNSLGGIASRADKVEAQRSRILDMRNDDRRELDRLERELADLGNVCSNRPGRRRCREARCRRGHSGEGARVWQWGPEAAG